MKYRASKQLRMFYKYWYVLQIAKTRIRYGIWFMISKRHHEVDVFVPDFPQYMDTYKNLQKEEISK